jgi:predicted XRE-type DNA-binding protein
VKRQALNQFEAAEKVGLDQADISRISHGQGARYSIERLLFVIGRLGLDIDIVQRHDKNGKIVIEVKELV